MDSSHHQRRIFYTFSHGTSNFSTPSTSSDTPNTHLNFNTPNNQPRNISPLKEKRYRRGYVRKRFSFHTLYNPQENRRFETCTESSTTQPIYTETPFQGGNNATGLSHDSTRRLVNQHRPSGCIFTHPSAQTIAPLPSFPLEQQNLSIPHSMFRDVPLTNGIYKNTTASTALGSEIRNSDFSLFGRSYFNSQNQGTSSSSYSEGIVQTFFSWFFGQKIQVSFISYTVFRPLGVPYRNNQHEIVCSSQKIAGSSTRSAKNTESINHHTTTPIIIHRESTSNNIGRVSCTSVHPTTNHMSQPTVSQGIRLECPYQHFDQSTKRITLVDTPLTTMEWSELHPINPPSGSLHRLIGQRMGDSIQSNQNFRFMDNHTTTTTHQLQRTFNDMTCHSPPSTARQVDTNILRQHHNNSICQSLQGNEITLTNAVGHRDLEGVHQDEHTDTTHVHCITTQPGRSPITTTTPTIGMECRSEILQSSRSTLGSPPSRLLRDTTEPQTLLLYDLASRPTSSCDGCSPPAMENMEMCLCVSTMEPSPTYNKQNSTRENSSNNNHTTLTQCNMVSNSSATQHTEPNNSASLSNSRSTQPRSTSPSQESSLAYDRMAYKRQRLTALGVDEEAAHILLNPTHNQQRTKQYQPIQRRFITWAQQHQIDPFTPNPVHVVNFLAYGRVHLKWATSTCAAYRSAILDLYHDTSKFHNNQTYQEFFIALNEQTIRSFDKPNYDISPAIQHIINLGNNNNMRPIDLTRKLCFLLAITGFLRPSDIERIDDNQSTITGNRLRLIIAVPKEKRRRQHIEKVITIKPHSNKLLCPVQTYTDYKIRFCQGVCRRSYPIPNGPCKYVYRLVRAVHNHDIPIGAERISNHIKHIIDLIPRPQGIARPKARALGSTAAVEAGASLEDFMVHGSWMSSSVFDTFYHLSRETATDFTSLALPSTSVVSTLDPQSTSVPAEE